MTYSGKPVFWGGIFKLPSNKNYWFLLVAFCFLSNQLRLNVSWALADSFVVVPATNVV